MFGVIFAVSNLAFMILFIINGLRCYAASVHYVRALRSKGLPAPPTHYQITSMLREQAYNPAAQLRILLSFIPNSITLMFANYPEDSEINKLVLKMRKYFYRTLYSWLGIFVMFIAAGVVAKYIH